MSTAIATITLVVADYDAAIAFYRDRLGFTLIADTDMGHGKRWVVVGPAGERGARLLLAKADGADQAAAIGNQTGGRVMLFLETDDFERDYEAMRANGVSLPRSAAPRALWLGRGLRGPLWQQMGFAAAKTLTQAFTAAVEPIAGGSRLSSHTNTEKHNGPSPARTQ